MILDAKPPVTSLFARLLCVLNGGHYRVLRIDGARLYLQCVACKYESPGWESAHHSLERTTR